MALKTLFIGYDLNRPGQDYANLIKEIKEVANGYWHHLDSTWLVRTEKTCTQVRDTLLPHMDHGDELLVMDVSGANWAASGFSQSGNDWLHKHL
ncbi:MULTISPECIES: hypothetical protein [Streptomyces]|uniref:hypothetical protein n=1 Tax=Streptomyces TaxID=1883 RepID=UPI00056A9F16|nr:MULTISPECIES: hypothetical protein [Streptomyces]KOU17823.1 hypothetical protein ADK49_15025 [Streptomyces sp. WM6349]KOV54826.1 hypothetical protein ADK98_03075 [Streptomyces sp. H036]